MYQKNKSIFIENKHTVIEISAETSEVLSVIQKSTNKDLKGDTTHFFSLATKDSSDPIIPTSILLNGDLLTVDTSFGDFLVKVTEYDDYFRFHLVTPMPTKVHTATISHIKYNYDFKNKENCGAAGIPLTYWVNPLFFPDAKSCETKADIMPYLKDIDAKYALVIAPINKHCEILKAITKTIDKNEGIKTPHGGAFSQESRLNFGNSTITRTCSPQYLKENLEFFKLIGVDQLDIHKGPDTYWQGDFSYIHYKDGKQFKEEVSDMLEKHGIDTGLHTYTHYIDYDCTSILSDPECQKDFSILEVFTLKNDIDSNSDFISTTESTAEVCDHYGFFTRNTPYIMIDNEIIEFQNAPDGFKVKQRGACGTTAVFHSKDSKVKHLDGFYHGVCPILGSDLFFRIARDTARAFDEGGYKTIYLDALDGIRIHCQPDETWFYSMAFIWELIRNCKREPMIEASTAFPALWLSRGRYGARDTISRGYKEWNIDHSNANRLFFDRYATATLGWYNLYPLREEHPGNLFTRYEHTDDVHHFGTMSIVDNTSMVFADLLKEEFDTIPALRRNCEIFRVYDKLRKDGYFSDEIIEKVRTGKYEYHIRQKGNGEFVFEEKKYTKKRLHNLNNTLQGSGSFNNPFKPQTPFIRIEAMLQTNYKNPVTLMELDENKTIEEQCTDVCFEKGLDLSDRIARTFSVWGNGKKGSAISVEMTCANPTGTTGIYRGFIDTDFEGRRDFVLVEADNGQRPDLPFDSLDYHPVDYTPADTTNPDLFKGSVPLHPRKIKMNSVYRSGFKLSNITSIAIRATAEARDVKVSTISACQHTFGTLINPSVQIGDNTITFICNLKSTDYLEFDGNTAKIMDRYGNETEVQYTGQLVAPDGNFTASLHIQNRNDCKEPGATLTFGFTGEEVK